MERIFLIDSMSHIFRAYFAPMGARQEPLRNSQGQVTQAVFVFTNMLRKLINDERPEYIAAVFDTAAPTFRHDSFEAYKANREEMPEDLAAQLPFIERVCEAFNIPILKYDGFEADDIIGTLAKKAAEKKMKAVIVSNDKDLCQLVRDPYIVAMRQNSQNMKRKVPVPPIEWCDEAWVENKFGLPPSKIIDLLGLMGDSIDNIPGAPGIGEKGALKLVQEFGSAIGAMENAEKVTHKTYRESLLNNQDIIRQSLELATVHTEVPIELDLDQLKRRDPDRKKAYDLFRELEFNTLTKEFADAATLFDMHGTDDEAGRVEQKYDVVRTPAELDRLIRTLWEKEKFAFYVDDSNEGKWHSAFDKQPPLGVAISYGAGVATLVDLENFEGGREAAVRPLADTFENPYLEKQTHDLKKNLSVLRKIGARIRSVTDDVMIASYLLDSGRPHHEIEFLAQTYLDAYPPTGEHKGFTAGGWQAAMRADWVFRLTPLLRGKITSDGLSKVYSEIELPVAPVLADIETAGMKVDTDALLKFSVFISGELEALQKKIYEIAGREFNIGSPKQVGEVFAELNIATGKKTATGQISTSKDVLAELAVDFEIAQLIIDYRELDKLKATYADALPKMVNTDGRIHGVLNQTVAATGRLSSTEPNLQNIPVRTELGQRIRAAFIPEKGNKLISADYSQLELRILAHITKDPVMLEAYQKGEDIHAKTARLVFGATDEKDLKEKRRLAKIVNFGIAYAVEAFGLSQRVGISKQEARKVIDDYFATYKGIRAYMDRIPEEAREKGYVTSLFGRRRYFPGIKDRNFAVRSRAEREAINMPIQGTASDIVKIAMINVARSIKEAGLKTQMIMQVHDELLFEAPENEVAAASEIIKHEMESAATLDVPLIAEIGIGDDWMSTK
ncbi:MAG TPA: DNA polymerase I [Pyrinomonadaceae bacterium]|nr:DNA polymerase I [Pyrinomonadaceae bacterium]